MKIRVVAFVCWCLVSGSASAGLLDKLPWVIAEKQAGIATAAAAAGVQTANSPFRVLVDYPNVNKFVLGVDVSGDVIAKAGGTLVTPAGEKAVEVLGHMPKSSVAAALGRFSMKVLPPVATAYALYDLARELGLDAADKADGTGQLIKYKEMAGKTAPQRAYERHFALHLTWCF